MPAIRLGVNVDHVATVRQARRTTEPDPVTAAALAELGGADSIVCHLREDRRHVQDRDLRILRETIQTQLNLEMALSREIVEIACSVRPHQVTLVPERREEITTEGGLHVKASDQRLRRAVARFHDAGIRVSLFLDPDAAAIEAAGRVGVEAVEIHTGTYANARDPLSRRQEISRIREAATLARNLRLFVAAGHGLTYTNVSTICRIPEIRELNIGHSIIARGIYTGIREAVREMKEILARPGCDEFP